MKKKRSFEFESDEFECYTTKNIGIIKLKSNVFNIVSSLGGSYDVFSIFEIAEQDDNIKLLLIMNENHCFSEEEYSNFLKKVTGGWSGTEKKMIRCRQITILNRFIMKMLNFNKLVISCLSGNIVTPFFGASLAADFRYVSEDMIYTLSHLKHKVHPSGALPYFLPKYVGFSKASELLFKNRNISSELALKLGLVNKIFPTENFEKHCIQEAQSFTEINSNVIKFTKHLLNFSNNELEKYFQWEECSSNIERI